MLVLLSSRFFVKMKVSIDDSDQVMFVDVENENDFKIRDSDFFINHVQYPMRIYLGVLILR